MNRNSKSINFDKIKDFIEYYDQCFSNQIISNESSNQLLTNDGMKMELISWLSDIEFQLLVNSRWPMVE